MCLISPQEKKEKEKKGQKSTFLEMMLRPSLLLLLELKRCVLPSVWFVEFIFKYYSQSQLDLNKILDLQLTSRLNNLSTKSNNCFVLMFQAKTKRWS